MIIAPSIELKNCSVYLPSVPRVEESLRRFAIDSLIGGHILKRSNGNSTLVVPISNISLTFNSGERVGILGVNGSGKTSLLRVVSGVWRPQEGEVKTVGRTTSLISLGLGSDVNLSGVDNALLIAAYYGMDLKLARKRLPDLIEFCELGEQIFHPVKTYSSGMKMRLLLGVATLTIPEILIMDEWIGTGDGRFREKARVRLEEFVSSSGLLILASHSMPLLRQWTTRCLWMHKSKVLMDDDTKTVADAYEDFLKTGELPKFE